MNQSESDGKCKLSSKCMAVSMLVFMILCIAAMISTGGVALPIYYSVV